MFGADLLTATGILTVVGFAVTIWQIRRSTSASEAARDATNELRNSIRYSDLVFELATVIAQLREIDRLLRQSMVGPIPERIIEVLQFMTRIQQCGYRFSDSHSARLVSAIQQLQLFKRALDPSRTGEGSPPISSASFEVISVTILNMEGLLKEVRSRVGVVVDG